MERVRDLMRPNPMVVTADTPLALCGRRMLEHPIRHLPVVDKGQIVGIIDDAAVFGCGVLLQEGLWFAFEADGPETAASISRPATTVNAEDPLPGALRKLVGQGALVVMDEGTVAGVLSEHDVVKLAPAVARETTTVGAMCNRPVVVIPPSTTARSALQQMQTQRLRHLVVAVDGSPIGVVSLRDVVAGWVSPESPVENCMARAPKTISSDATLRQAATLMGEKKIGCLPVVDGDGRAMGILTRTDILHAVAEAVEDEALFGET